MKGRIGFRAGRTELAGGFRTVLTQAHSRLIDDLTPRASLEFFLAMTLARLGQQADGAAWLARASQSFQKEIDEPTLPAVEYEWAIRARLQRLQTEAEAAIPRPGRN